ncbi:MAG: cytochrome c [Pseudomonadota bacterium]
MMAYTKVVACTAIAALTLGLAACGDAPGEGGAGTPPIEAAPPPVVEERQANFKAMGKAFKAIRTQLEGESPDKAAIATAATDLNAAALKIEGYFPEGTSVDDGYDTEALATIWEKPEDFAAAHQRLVDASAQMITLAEGGDVTAIGDQVGAIGGSCKNCHDTFRLDTD